MCPAAIPAKNVIVYQKGDIVKGPMKSIPFLPKIVPGVRWGWGGVCHAGVGVGHTGVGWGGVCSGGWVMQGWVGCVIQGQVCHVVLGVGVGHAGVGWVIQGWGGSCRGRVGHVGVGVGCVMQGWGWGGSYRGGVGWVM